MKLKSLILTFFSPLFIYSQSSESIAKMYCKCDVINSSELLKDNKIVFIANENESFLGVNLTYNIIQKVNGQWIKKRKSKISFNSNDVEDNEKIKLEDFSFAQQNENAKEISVKKINNTDYFYSIIDLGMNGTASNGMNAFLFLFQDTDYIDKPIKLYYERWNGEFSGNYKTDFNSIDDYSNFIEETNKFISDKFGVTNDDIDSPENFHLKWNNLNDNVFERINDSNEAYVRFVNYNSNDLFEKIKNEYEVEEIENDSYKLITGFISPTIVYDKKSDESIIVFIPQGWPNGGGWGFRSFYPKNIIGDKITIESDDEILTIDLKSEISDGYLSRIKKED